MFIRKEFFFYLLISYGFANGSSKVLDGPNGSLLFEKIVHASKTEFAPFAIFSDAQKSSVAVSVNFIADFVFFEGIIDFSRPNRICGMIGSIF